MKKINQVMIGLIVLLIIAFMLTEFSTRQNQNANSCNKLKENFDIYVEKSNLPIIDNSESLCHGLYIGSNFSNLEPKWAIGELVEIKGSALTLKGISRNITLSFNLTNEEIKKYEIGKYYKIDMNNICRNFFMMVDSRFPSPIGNTLVKPEQINCE